MCLIRMNKVCNIFHFVSMKNMTYNAKRERTAKAGRRADFGDFPFQ